MSDDETPKPAPRARRVERAADTRMVRIRPGQVVAWMHPEPGVSVGHEWASVPADAAERLVAAAAAQVEVRKTGTESEEA